MGKNPSKFQNDKNLPVEQVNWNDCQEFSKKLLVKDKKPYHLQTEAEWEYACRAGVPRLPCRSLQPYPLPPISEELHPCQIASGLAWLGMHLGIRHHSKPLVRFHFPVPPNFLLPTLLLTNYWSQFMLTQGDPPTAGQRVC